jgi:hypothetical protein
LRPEHAPGRLAGEAGERDDARVKRTALLLLTLLAACGQGPAPLGSPGQAPEDGHEGHDHPPGQHPEPAAGPLPPGAEVPNDPVHAGLGQPAQPPAHFGDPDGDDYAGVVRLRGGLAALREGYLFVSVMPEGTNYPACFDRFDLSDPAVGAATDEERVIDLLYTGCSAPAGGVELKVQFDVDGYVETKDERTVVRRFSIERAAQDIDVVVDDRDDGTE